MGDADFSATREAPPPNLESQFDGQLGEAGEGIEGIAKLDEELFVEIWEVRHQEESLGDVVIKHSDERHVGGGIDGIIVWGSVSRNAMCLPTSVHVPQAQFNGLRRNPE